METRQTSDLTGRQTVTSRLLNAPRDIVFEAITNPEHLIHWWGPNGFTNTIYDIDVKPGGKWRYTMHGPDGTNYDNECVFGDITRPERIVIRHISGHEFELIFTLLENPAGTVFNWNMVFADEKEFQAVKEFVIPANEQNLDRLAAYICIDKCKNQATG